MLGYHDFLDGLTRGVAAHHAGMLPAFKQVVEELYVRGLCKVVFATETLALGINMPARTVVIEKLSKWNGETHADITPGEYTQLTGRAGRRGLDVEGHGVVLWQPGMEPKQVAGLASTRTYPLRSSFRPSYNMAVNLVHQFGRERSRELLEQSFAQFQADKAVVGLARQLRKAEEALEGYAEAATCHLGDFMEYARAAAPDRRRGEGGEPGPEVRPAGRGAGLADQAQAGGRDRRTRREVLGPGRGGRSRHVRRQPPPVRRHRRSAGATAGGRRLPDAGRAAHPAPDPEELQRPQPADASRPGLGAARPHPRPDPAAGPRAAAARRRGPEDERDRRGSGPSCGHTRATAAPTGRTTPAGPSAGSSSTATPPRCGGGWSVVRTPWRGSSTASATC